MAKKIYVAYGSNMSEEQMGYRCPDAKILGKGIINDWRLMFKGELPSSYATIEEWENFYVPVILWEISAKDERRLDRYEGYPSHYQKREVEVVTESGDKVTGMVYVKSEEEPLNLPSDHYYAVLYDAYEKFEFDLKVLKAAFTFSDRSNRTFNFR